MTISTPVRELIETVSAPFERARAMPPSVYTSPEFLLSEIEDVFAREWVCVGRASALRATGDYLTYEVAGQPVIVLRDASGELRALSNVCRHRMSTIMEGAGSCRALVCPYHGWTYNLDGALRGAPAMDRNQDFAKAEDLPPAPAHFPDAPETLRRCVIGPWRFISAPREQSSMILPRIASSPPAATRDSRRASITPPAAAAVERPGSFTQANG